MVEKCNKDDILKNVRRVYGQVQGIEKMIQEERELIDVLQQVTAANSALKGVGRSLLQDYANGCFNSKKLDKKDLEKVIEQIFKVM